MAYLKTRFCPMECGSICLHTALMVMFLSIADPHMALDEDPTNMYHTFASQVRVRRHGIPISCYNKFLLAHMLLVLPALRWLTLCKWLPLQVLAALDCGKELGLWSCLTCLRHGLLCKVDAKVKAVRSCSTQFN